MCIDLTIRVPRLNLAWIGDLFLQWMLIAGATLAGMYWPILWPAIWLFYGTRQAALSVLGHDAMHRHVAPDNPLLNDALGALAFWPLTTTLVGYRRFHLPHHAWLGDRYRDEELRIQMRHRRTWYPQSRSLQVVRDLCGAGLPEIFDLQHVMHGGHRQRAIPMLTTVVAAAGALLAAGLWQPVIAWFAALGTVFFALVRLRGWTEHIGMTPGLTRWKSRPPWWQRATYHPLGIWAHVEHHRHPGRTWRELVRQ